MLAGVSVDYYIRLERGRLSGASPSVLNALAQALQLDADEQAYLLDLASGASEVGDDEVDLTDSIRAVLASISVPAIILNRRLDLLAANPLGRALHSGAYQQATPGEAPNLARYTFLAPSAAEFYQRHDDTKDLTVAMLRSATGHDPLDQRLISLIGELSTYSPDFAIRWAQHDVHRHTSGHKGFNHPLVGPLELDYDDFTPPGAPELMLTTYTAEPGSPTQAALAELAKIAANPPAAGQE